MDFPHIIPPAVKDVYEPSKQLRDLLKDSGRRIEAENFTPQLVPSLRMWCLKTIAQNVNTLKPIMDNITRVDYNYLIEILPVDLRLEYAIDIEDDFYWERRYEVKWTKPFWDRGVEQFWKREYFSMITQELIENCSETPNQVELDMIGKYVNKLTITKFVEVEGHVEYPALDVVLSSLSNLTELCFSFTPDILKGRPFFVWSPQALKSIRYGLYDMNNLKVLRIRRCLMDEAATVAFVKCMTFLENVEEFEVSHCGLDDEGAVALSYVLLYHRALKTLIVRDGRFGDRGMQAIAYGLLFGHPFLRRIDLQKNFMSDLAASYLASAITRISLVREMVLSSCGLKGPSACLIAGALKFNSSLEMLDVSANDFSGEAISVLFDSLKFNKVMRQVDVRDTRVPEILRSKLRALKKSNEKLNILGLKFK